MAYFRPAILRRQFLLGAAVLTAFPRVAFGEDSVGGVVAVASEHNAGPYAYNLRGRRRGYDVEMVDLVVADLRMLAVHYAMEREAIFKALDDEKVDFAFSFTSTPERAKKYIQIAPLHAGRLALATRRDDMKEPFGIAALAGRRLATTVGHRYPPEIEAAANFTLMPCSSMTLGFRRLASGRVDAVVGERNSLAFQMKALGLERQLAISATDLWTGSYSCLFPKSRRALATAFAGKLREMEAAGRFADLMARFPGVSPPVP
jgi:polar amino acid transport system substrate-binding protein